MDHNLTTLERAFQIASSGSCRDIKGLKQQIKDEGYATSQIEGRQLVRQLRALIDVHAAENEAPSRPDDVKQ